MTHLIQVFDRFIDWFGTRLAFFSLIIALITFLVVVMRYGFNSGQLGWGDFQVSSIALQESAIYFHAALFMLASGYSLKQDAHVRVDVLYRQLSRRAKALINLLGNLLLLCPMAGFILYSSLDFVGFSWQIKERSPEAEGLPYVYLLKTLIPAMAVLLLFQALVESLRNLLALLETNQLNGESPEQL